MTSSQVFSCEFGEIFSNTVLQISVEYLRTSVPVKRKKSCVIATTSYLIPVQWQDQFFFSSIFCYPSYASKKFIKAFKRKHVSVCNIPKYLICLRLILPSRAYSSCFMHAIVARIKLPFFKIFSNFVHFRPNFQIVLLFFLPFFWKTAGMPFLSRKSPAVIKKPVIWLHEAAKYILRPALKIFA